MTCRPAASGAAVLRGALAIVMAALTVGLVPLQNAAATDPSPCPGLNAIACENTNAGTPQAVWDIAGSGDDTIQGFATDISYNVGEVAKFKVKTDANAYTVDIYRLGWYGGNGARKVASIAPAATLPQTQPACSSDPSTGLYDCGTWGVSATWSVPTDAVSGIYIAKLTRADTGGASHITFIVRNDASTSDVLFQTSDPTWQAYNQYGGADFYMNSGNFAGTGQARAFKISYNRPIATRGASSGRDFLFANEFPMLQFLERNGYDTSYTSGIDSARRGALIKNHKVFVSTGHDEYWSGAQRANVEAARDAGVNLAFFSGNEVYWRTRLEPSIDGSATADRTLVSYKETWSNAKIDPSTEWTGTWRDPRFATKAQGGNLPENGLTGTLYMSNNTDLPITVLKSEAQTRLWRNTGLSAMTATSTALAAHTIGYESDEDLDNGSRPAGLIRLSTTTGSTTQYLRDYGNTVTPGTTTHHLTLYRAPSGALVFGAGTIQWAWGLSAIHDGVGAAADVRIQQATVNLFADMKAQPSSLMPGIVAASASADTTAPSAAISSPVANAAIANGTSVTVTGTASDSGGVVAGVEVSTDGGSTWHPATGLTSWTYSYTQTGDGAASIKARAIDDSANIGVAATQSITTSCPCSLFGQQAPAIGASSDTSAVELGVRFKAAKDGYVSGVRFYKGTGNTGTHTGSLWTTTGSQLATGTFSAETPTGWQTLKFANPVAITAGTTYVASYFAPVGRYAADSRFFSAGDYVASPLTAPGRPNDVNGVYGNGGGVPSSSYGDTNYWVDVLFSSADTSPPVLTGQTPLPGASSVAASVAPTATFGAAISTLTLSFVLRNSAGTAVGGTTTYDTTARTATFTPSSVLAPGATYTAAVTASSSTGVAMTSAQTWSFTVAKPTPAPGICPCSIWNDATTPTTITANDSGNVALGVKFTADVDGTVTGVRFYKGPKNTGTHTGSLWSSTGTQLATATFTTESSTGWQTVTFGTAVPVTAGTTYTASYRAPVGYYSADVGAFGTAGVDSPPLHVPVNGAVYTYGSGAPTSASSANYWVDVVFTANDLAPVVSSTSPGYGATIVGISSTVSATFASTIQSGTATVALVSASGTTVSGAITYDATTRTVTLTPTVALSATTSYTATVSGAKALSGAVMTPYSWSFTTATAGACPCTLFDPSAVPATVDTGDRSSVEVGTKFSATSNGNVTGLRFYKSTANTGTHVGSLWTSTGTRLAGVTFTGESSSGWQTASFSTPVAITAGTTFVVSYLAPSGHYSASSAFFASAYSRGPLAAPSGSNGVYAYGQGGFPTGTYNSTNYWVDPIFVPVASSSAPTVTAQTPAAGSSSVPLTSAVTATFSVGVDPASVAITVTGKASGSQAGTLSYDATSRTSTFTPSTMLVNGDTYTVSVRATGTDGTAMPSAQTWTFVTATAASAPGVCPCSVWNDGTQPAVASWNDTASVELGMKFTADVAGTITGVRFYKGSRNTGMHTATLWSTSGTALATATFTNESTSGWQTVSFATPVAVTASTTYVVSYRAPTGGYAVTSNGLATVIDSSPLHTVAGGGVYGYGSGFPSSTTSTNYWVDPVFAR